MKIKEIMSSKIEVVHPNDPLQTVAQKMKIYDVGFLPVFDNGRLIGVISDRDIVIRAMADGLNPKAALGRDLITSPAVYCFDDQEAAEAARLMLENQIRRLVVLNRDDKRLAGVVSLGDLIGNIEPDLAAHILQSVFEPIGAH